MIKEYYFAQFASNTLRWIGEYYFRTNYSIWFPSSLFLVRSRDLSQSIPTIHIGSGFECHNIFKVEHFEVGSISISFEYYHTFSLSTSGSRSGDKKAHHSSISRERTQLHFNVAKLVNVIFIRKVSSSFNSKFCRFSFKLR